jgi:hypothetical protein
MKSSQLFGGWFEPEPFTPAITQAMPHSRSDLSMKARRDFGMTTELIKANDIIINLCRIWKNYLLMSLGKIIATTAVRLYCNIYKPHRRPWHRSA